LFASDIAGGVLILTHLWSLRAGQEVQTSGLTTELPWPDYPYSLKGNFPFHPLFLDFLLSRSDLKGREFKREEAKS
jgi:hypothetical protein